MLRIERLNAIKELIDIHHSIKVSDLCDKFKVSEVTIRNDLSFLEEQGFLKKTYGGAVQQHDSFIIDTNELIDSNYNTPSNYYEIAKLASRHIAPRDTIFLGSGRTCCELAKLINPDDNISVVTNNISALADLHKNASKLYLIGGEVTSVDNTTLFASIEDPLSYVKNIYIAKSFTSASGIDIHNGITVNSTISSHIYKCFTNSNQKWFLMADHKKFTYMGLYKVADITDVTCIISDSIPQDIVKSLNDIDIETNTLY